MGKSFVFHLSLWYAAASPQAALAYPVTKTSSTSRKGRLRQAWYRQSRRLFEHNIFLLWEFWMFGCVGLPERDDVQAPADKVDPQALLVAWAAHDIAGFLYKACKHVIIFFYIIFR